MASASKYPAVQAVKTLHQTNQWTNYFKEGNADSIEKDYLKVEAELAKGKRSVRRQIEKAKAFVEKFSADLEIRRAAADASPELLTLWGELKLSYQAENDAGEKVQECLDKYPKTSGLIQQTKQSIDTNVNCPELFERLIIVTKLDTERKKLQKLANEAKATRLEVEKTLTVKGISHDPSYIPAPSYMTAERSIPECY